MDKLSRQNYSQLLMKSMQVTNLDQLLGFLRTEFSRLMPCDEMEVSMGRKVGPGYLFVWKGCFDLRAGLYSPATCERFSEEQVYFMHWLSMLNPIVMLQRQGAVATGGPDATTTPHAESYVVRHAIQRDQEEVFGFFTVRGVPAGQSDRAQVAARMRVLAPVLHAVLARLLKAEPSSDFSGRLTKLEIQLLPTQLLVLAWMCAGLSNEAIAKVLQRPSATIDRHVQGVIEALDVNSRREAVVEACLQGMMAQSSHLQQLAGSIYATLDRMALGEDRRQGRHG